MTRSERNVKEKWGETGTASLLLTPLPVQSLVGGDLELRGAKEPALGRVSHRIRASHRPDGEEPQNDNPPLPLLQPLLWQDSPRQELGP